MKDIILRVWALAIVAIALGVQISCATGTESGGGKEGEGEELFTLVVLHTNDLHARMREFNKYGNTTSEEESAAGEGFGGVARIATKVKELRDDATNVLLLDAGDQFQGTLFYSLYKGEASKIFMNMLGYDAMTLGNHEFDDGPQELAPFVSGLDFPVVSANVKVENEPLLRDLIEPWVILDVDRHKVGILGFTTQEVPMVSKPGPNVVFEDIASSAQEVVDELEGQDVNIIIALSHSGLGKDMEIAGSVDGIDIIVGGHTHSLLSNTDENAEGPYPVMVTSPSGEPVLIVTAKSWGQYLGHLEVQFDDEGVAETWSGEPILLDATVPEDPEYVAKVQDMSEEVDMLRGMVIGETLTGLEGTELSCRHGESNLGNLIADAILWDSLASGATIGLYNGGGIRSGVPAGPITMAQALEVLPFTDTIATLDLLGSDLKEVLEYSVSRAEDPLNEGTGRFLQVSGLRFAWDPNQPVGSRILGVGIRNQDGTFSPLMDDNVYKIATSAYLREGGDGYAILRDRAILPYDFGRVISDVVVEYIELNSPLNPQVEGRIRRAP